MPRDKTFQLERSGIQGVPTNLHGGGGVRMRDMSMNRSKFANQ